MTDERDARRLTLDQAAALPDRREAGLRGREYFLQPLRVPASVAGSVDKCAGEYVVPVHA